MSTFEPLDMRFESTPPEAKSFPKVSVNLDELDLEALLRTIGDSFRNRRGWRASVRWVAGTLPPSAVMFLKRMGRLETTINGHLTFPFVILIHWTPPEAEEKVCVPLASDDSRQSRAFV